MARERLPDELVRDLHLLTRVAAATSAIAPPAVLQQIVADAGLTLFDLDPLRKKVEAQLEKYPDGWAEYNQLFAKYRRVLFDEQVVLRGLDPQGLEPERDWDSVMQLQARIANAQRLGREAIAEDFRRSRPLSVKELFREVDSLLADPASHRRREFIEKGGLVWIDWRDDPSDVVDAFSGGFSRYQLRIKGEDPLALYFRKRTVSLELHHTPADRFRLLLAINQVLHPDFEVRFARDSRGETLGFAALDCGAWRTLERRYSRVLLELFSPLEPSQDLWNLEATTPR